MSPAGARDFVRVALSRIHGETLVAKPKKGDEVTALLDLYQQIDALAAVARAHESRIAALEDQLAAQR